MPKWIGFVIVATYCLAAGPVPHHAAAQSCAADSIIQGMNYGELCSDDVVGHGCGFGPGCCGKRGCLKSLIKPSDHCFDDFISPMLNFVFFEDPRTVTELRPVFVNHWVPSRIGNDIPADGTIELYALQFRAALTDKLSLIAVKDGFIVDGTRGALDTLLQDGWAAVTAGLKYNLFRNPCQGTIASAGFTYEIPVGSQRALQDIGNGEFHLFVTGGQRLLQGNAHWLTASDIACRSKATCKRKRFTGRTTLTSA